MPLVQPAKTAMPCSDPVERRSSWDEVALGYTEERAVAEAQRCLRCQEPLCELGCPVSVPIREFVHHVAQRRFADAAASIRRANLLPAICGRVCPVEHQCESRCVLAPRFEPVAIGRLERFVADWERTHGPVSVPRPSRRAESVAIVGSGPAGLTAASDLAQRGYRVTVFEALHAFGGVLRYGIPEYRLPKAIVDENLGLLTELGVEFARDVVVGKTVTIDQLLSELGYSAVFVGTGAGAPVFLDVPGENLKGVYSANEFLTRVNLMHAYAFPAYDTPLQRPTRAAVVGAGDTAMDAARCAIRLGATESHIVYRRSEREKGARAEDFHRAAEEGVIFDWQTLPRRFVGGPDGWVVGVDCIRTELGEPDESGRRRPIPVEGSEFRLDADLVVIALGTRPNPLVPQATSGLAVDAHGAIVADPDTGATSRDGVFAGGDIVTGAATVILAMGAGRRAATAIDEFVQIRNHRGRGKETEMEHHDGSKPLLAELEAAGIAYERLPHSRTMTALAEADVLGVEPGDVAKTIVLSTPAGHVRAVIPASERLDLAKARLALGETDVHLLSEADLAEAYPEFELGAVPPLGGAHRDRTLIDDSVCGHESVLLEAGSHAESVRVAVRDLVLHESVSIADICVD